MANTDNNANSDGSQTDAGCPILVPMGPGVPCMLEKSMAQHARVGPGMPPPALPMSGPQHAHAEPQPKFITTTETKLKSMSDEEKAGAILVVMVGDGKGDHQMGILPHPVKRKPRFRLFRRSIGDRAYNGKAEPATLGDNALDEPAKPIRKRFRLPRVRLFNRSINDRVYKSVAETGTVDAASDSKHASL